MENFVDFFISEEIGVVVVANETAKKKDRINTYASSTGSFVEMIHVDFDIISSIELIVGRCKYC